MPCVSAVSGGAEDVSELTTRILSGIALIVVALGAAVLGGLWFALLVAAASGMMFVEWTRMVRGWGFGWIVAGFFYALVPAVALLWIRVGGHHKLDMLIWVFIVTWSTDIGAYVAGRTIGGPKLAPSVSPNKTWAGLAGGMVAATLFGTTWVIVLELPHTLIWLAPLFAIGAQLGDLFESGLKRRAGVKDSGRILPGHGGVMDRLDGLVVVATLAALAEIAGWT